MCNFYKILVGSSPENQGLNFSEFPCMEILFPCSHITKYITKIHYKKYKG